jgi:hypothetical protein
VPLDFPELRSQEGDQRLAHSTHLNCAVRKGVSGLPTQLATRPTERTPADLALKIS